MKNHTILILSGLFLLIFFPMNSYSQDNLWKNWVKSGDNPIVYPAGTWFDVAFGPVVLYEEGKFKMWFSGNNQEWAKGCAGMLTDINELTTQNQISLSISPSFFTDMLTITYSVTGKTNVKLAVYSLNGQFISTLVNEIHTPGSFEVQFNGDGLIPGTYCCVLTTQGGTITKKFIKVD